MKKIISFFIIIIALAGGVYYGLQNNKPEVKADPNVLSLHSSGFIPTVTIVSTPDFNTPEELIIPKINVDAAVESVGLDAQGNMDIPKRNADVAWYKLGNKPGQPGNAVIAGHLDTVNGTPSVFWDLGKLEVGDEIKLIDNNGHKLIYHVTGEEEYPNNNFPVNEVFGNSDTSNLNLITCGGTWNQVSKIYTHRTVIYSRLSQ